MGKMPISLASGRGEISLISIRGVNMGWAKAHWVIILVLAMLTWVGACTPSDPYARNPLGADPRAIPMAKRKAGTTQPSSESIVADFKALHRPIIQRYKTYTPTTRECILGELDYTHIILTDEACAFVRRYTWEEMVIALAPLLQDHYWSGDVVATLSAASNPFKAGRILSAEKYLSPDDQGSWAKYQEDNLRDWSVGRGHGPEGSHWGILRGKLYDFSKYEIEHPLPTRPGAPRD